MDAGEVARYYRTLDDRTLKPLRESKSKIRTTAQKYWDVCDAQLQLRDAELTRQGTTLPSDGKNP